MKKIDLYKYRFVNFIKYFSYKAKLIKNIETIGFIPKSKVDLSICAIIKNEGKYLKEWIEFHLMTGIKYFFLYDNESSDDTFYVLKPYIEKGIVIYHKVRGGDADSCELTPNFRTV